MMLAKMRVLGQDTWQKRLGPFLPVLFFWAVLVAITSTSTAPGGVERTWAEELRRSIVSWTIWVLLAPLIVTIDRWLPVSREALFKRFVFHIPLSLIFTMLRQLLYYVAVPLLLSSGSQPPPFEAVRASFRGLFQSNFLSYWIIIFVYFALQYQERIKERELQALDLERVIAESRLETLRAQLRPNFVFNALNAISGHLERSPRIARRMLGELGELLRLSLAYSEEQEVPLAEEIGFLDHYLEIQKSRFEERLGATVEVEPDVLHALVPTFILQPMVEAIFNGISPDLSKSCIKVRAWRNQGQLHLRVQCNESDFLQDWDAGDGASIGISNTRERLRRMYGNQDQNFEVFSEQDSGVRLDISIPFREG
jgi:two-component system, LytTR family, sensor kinase